MQRDTTHLHTTLSIVPRIVFQKFFKEFNITAVMYRSFPTCEPGAMTVRISCGLTVRSGQAISAALQLWENNRLELINAYNFSNCIQLTLAFAVATTKINRKAHVMIDAFIVFPISNLSVNLECILNRNYTRTWLDSEMDQDPAFILLLIDFG
jgi:hypothetical protein